MTLNVTTVGDNPQTPSVTAYTYVPDQLIAGDLKIVSQPIGIASGTYARGTVMGQISSSSVVSTPGTNTGNGTIGTLSAGTGAKAGSYVLTATSATQFSVVDPEGNAQAAATVGTAYAAGGINFTITAGGTAFAAGDSFKLLVEDSVGNFIPSVKTATDGSQVPCAILADYADASLGPVTAGAYFMVEVNANRLIYDTSWSIQALTTALRPFGIFVKSSVSAADPT